MPDNVESIIEMVKTETKEGFTSHYVEANQWLFDLTTKEAIIKLAKTYVYREYSDHFTEIFGTKLQDNRFSGRLSRIEKEEYFKEELSKKQNNNKPILNEKDIKHFLHANFIEFSPSTEIKKFDTPNISAAKLNRIFYDFYKNDSKETRTEKYVKLLENNFSIFSEFSFESLKSNFSK